MTFTKNDGRFMGSSTRTVGFQRSSKQHEMMHSIRPSIVDMLQYNSQGRLTS